MAGGDTVYQKEVRVRRITTLGHVAAQGLADPSRVRILEALAQKAMTADEIARALGSSGQKKATTTVRHHLEILKEAGLVEATRMVEARGAVMKYYAPTIRVYSCDTPGQAETDIDGKAAKLIDDTSAKLAKIVAGIQGDRRFAALVSSKNGKCSEFLALEILNAALAKAVAAGVPAASKAQQQAK
jgi:DNA-binding transcriptional ArsR family regulator